jgi:hypothetical protein
MRESDKFIVGFCLSALALYLLYDSVYVAPGRTGVFADVVSQLTGHTGSPTSQMLIILFVPFLLGFLVLLHDEHAKWAWALIWVGGFMLVIEAFSRFGLLVNVRFPHFLGALPFLGAAVFPPWRRGYRDTESGS